MYLTTLRKVRGVRSGESAGPLTPVPAEADRGMSAWPEQRLPLPALLKVVWPGLKAWLGWRMAVGTPKNMRTDPVDVRGTGMTLIGKPLAPHLTLALALAACSVSGRPKPPLSPPIRLRSVGAAATLGLNTKGAWRTTVGTGVAPWRKTP